MGEPELHVGDAELLELSVGAFTRRRTSAMRAARAVKPCSATAARSASLLAKCQ